tara:strand:+ start:163 stop:348 length:186 start_codon:yes stop_codon:yes gene_type:complete
MDDLMFKASRQKPESGDSPAYGLMIHMWTPPLARADFVEMRVIGCFHMSGLFMRLRKRRWP